MGNLTREELEIIIEMAEEKPKITIDKAIRSCVNFIDMPAFWYVIIKGKTIKETAEITGNSEDFIKVGVERSMKNLEEMEDELWFFGQRFD